MITNRPFREEDVPALTEAMGRDHFHPGEWKPEHITAPNVLKCVEVFEDTKGPIVYWVYTKTLRISTIWNDDQDVHRNGRAIIVAVKDAIEKARSDGYSEIIFTTDVPRLANFCERALGFHKSGNEYILPL